MRMWMVDPRLMCRKHLLGEHVETHMFVGTLVRGISVEGYIDKNLFEFKSLKERHDLLAAEIQRRGYQHNSVLPPFTPAFLRTLPNPIELSQKVLNSTIDQDQASHELFHRCPECLARKKIVV